MAFIFLSPTSTWMVGFSQLPLWIILPRLQSINSTLLLSFWPVQGSLVSVSVSPRRGPGQGLLTHSLAMCPVLPHQKQTTTALGDLQGSFISSSLLSRCLRVVFKLPFSPQSLMFSPCVLSKSSASCKASTKVFGQWHLNHLCIFSSRSNRNCSNRIWLRISTLHVSSSFNHLSRRSTSHCNRTCGDLSSFLFFALKVC